MCAPSAACYSARMTPSRIRARSWSVSPLEVPLFEPFVIACGTVTTTRNALVRVEIEDGDGRRATGLGEAATLTPVTEEDLPDALANLAAMEGPIVDRWIAIDATYRDLGALLDGAARGAVVSRAGAETALLDAIARLAGAPLFDLLRAAEIEGAPAIAAGARAAMTTDITIPIRPVETMASLARAHRAQGFTCFKVKVGRDVAHDLAAIEAIAGAVPDAAFRIDANGGFSARDAIALAEGLAARRISVECFEQPCATDDLRGMAEVARSIAAPVIADESVKHLDDVRAILDERAANGVNLKLAKSGGPLAALAIGRAAKRAGLSLMCGGMVETRVGMTAAAHVVAALGGVDFVDLDTAWLLAEERFEGGYVARGPEYALEREPGLGVRER